MIGALIGWDNCGGLTVFIGSNIASHVEYQEQLVNELSRLPGLTTVVIWDLGAESEKFPTVIELKRRLGESAPHVRFEHVHLPNLGVRLN